MTDEERFAKDLRDLALSIRAPERLSAALDRAAARTVSHQTSGFSLRSRLAVAAAGIVAVVVLAASLIVATAPASASDLLVRAERAGEGDDQDECSCGHLQSDYSPIGHE